MPIYEYICEDCEHTFEYLVFGGAGPEKCLSCSCDKIKKLMSTCGFISKGSSGETVSSSASSSSCSGCSSTSCSTCGI